MRKTIAGVTRLTTAARTAVVAIVIMLTLAAMPVRAQVLSKVPADAIMVVRVANLQQTSAKLAKFAQQLGVAGFIPDATDPLSAIKRESEMVKGINDAGELAIVMLDPEQGQPEDGLIVLIPVSNYDEFVSNFKNTAPKGNLTSFDNNGDKGFIANWGSHAAVTKWEENVARTSTGLNVAGPAGKQLAEHDICMYFNVVKVRPQATGALAEARVQMSRAMQMAANQQANTPNAAYMPLASAMMSSMINAIDTTIQQTDSGTIGFTIQDDGIAGAMLGQTSAGSELNAIVTGIKPAQASVFRGLGDNSYLFFGGMALDPQVTTKAVDLFAKGLKEELAKDPNNTDFQKVIDATRASLVNTKSMNFGMVAPTGALGQSSLFQLVGTTEGNADAIMKATRENFEAQIGMMKKMVPADQAEKMGITYTPGGTTVDGVVFDEFTSKMVMGGTTPQEQQVAQVMAMFYGPQGMKTWTGKVSDTRILTVIGEQALISPAIAAVKAEADNLSSRPNVKMVADKLPANRFGEVYIPLDVTISTAAKYAQQMGLPMNLQLPPNLPPIGMAMTAEEGSIRMNGFIPTQLLQSLISAGMQTYMQMQQQAPPPAAQPGQPGAL